MNKKISIDLSGMPPTEVHKLLARLNGYGIKFVEEALGLIKPSSLGQGAPTPPYKHFDFPNDCVTPEQYDTYEGLPEFTIVAEIIDSYMNQGNLAQHPEEEIGMLQDHTRINVLAATILHRLSDPIQKRVKMQMGNFEAIKRELTNQLHHMGSAIEKITRQHAHLRKDIASLINDKSTASFGAPVDLTNGYTGPSSEELEAELRRQYYAAEQEYPDHGPTPST